MLHNSFQSIYNRFSETWMRSSAHPCTESGAKMAARDRMCVPAIRPINEWQCHPFGELINLKSFHFIGRPATAFQVISEQKDVRSESLIRQQQSRVCVPMPSWQATVRPIAVHIEFCAGNKVTHSIPHHLNVLNSDRSRTKITCVCWRIAGTHAHTGQWALLSLLDEHKRTTQYIGGRPHVEISSVLLFCLVDGRRGLCYLFIYSFFFISCCTRLGIWCCEMRTHQAHVKSNNNRNYYYCFSPRTLHLAHFQCSPAPNRQTPTASAGAAVDIGCIFFVKLHCSPLLEAKWHSSASPYSISIIQWHISSWSQHRDNQRAHQFIFYIILFTILLRSQFCHYSSSTSSSHSHTHRVYSRRRFLSDAFKVRRSLHE